MLVVSLIISLYRIVHLWWPNETGVTHADGEYSDGVIQNFQRDYSCARFSQHEYPEREGMFATYLELIVAP